MTSFRSLEWQKTRIKTELDFVSSGKRIGDLQLKPSNNQMPLGYIPIPVGVVIGKPGPTILLTAGIHGDEYEGQIALRKLLFTLDPSTICGRLIILPSLNTPAVHAATRVSPLDQGNLNRAFPGCADGGPTAEIANLLESIILPVCDAAIDLHSGGKAAWFLPCTMAGRDRGGSLSSANIELAQAFDLPHILLMNALNDDRSLNAAACRQNVTMIAVELGGGGQVTPEVLALAEHGLENCLAHLEVVSESAVSTCQSSLLEIKDAKQSVFAPHRGLFEPAFSPGQHVVASSIAGYIYSLEEPDRPASRVKFSSTGVALMRCHKGLVERGDLISMVGIVVEP